MFAIDQSIHPFFFISDNLSINNLLLRNSLKLELFAHLKQATNLLLLLLRILTRMLIVIVLFRPIRIQVLTKIVVEERFYDEYLFLIQALNRYLWEVISKHICNKLVNLINSSEEYNIIIGSNLDMQWLLLRLIWDCSVNHWLITWAKVTLDSLANYTNV